jgi:hypothetical protein
VSLGKTVVGVKLVPGRLAFFVRAKLTRPLKKINYIVNQTFTVRETISAFDRLTRTG